MTQPNKFNGNHVLLGHVMVHPENARPGAPLEQVLITLTENTAYEKFSTPSREILNIATTGMPGSGKSRLLEANLLCWKHSAVVVDLKGGLYRSTAAYRASFGAVHVLDVRHGSGTRINPVALVRDHTRRALAVELVSQGENPSGSDRFWSNAAANVWLACWYAADDVDKPHIPYAVELLSKNLASFLNYMRVYHGANNKVRRLIEGFIGEPLTEKYIERLIEFGPSKLLGNKWGSVEESVTVFSEDENMLKIFSGNDIDIARMFKSPTTIYVIADENNVPVFQAFTRLVMRAIGDRLIEVGDQLEFGQRRPILFLFDEFGAARVNNARVWLNTMRSRGIVLWLFTQSIAQFPSETKGDYNPDRENSIHHWIMFAPSYGDSETGQFISKLSGKTTIAVAGGASSSRSLQDGRSNVSESISYKERWNTEAEDTDAWGINEAAVSIRPNGRARRYYGRVLICTAENTGLAERRGPAAAYHLLPEYEPCALPDPAMPGEEDAQEQQQHDGRGRRGPGSTSSARTRPAPNFDPLSLENHDNAQGDPAHHSPSPHQTQPDTDHGQTQRGPLDYVTEPSQRAQLIPGNIYGDQQHNEEELRNAHQRRDVWDDIQEDDE